MSPHAFTLTRYFSLLSLLFILFAGTALGLLVRQHEIGQLEQVAEQRNVVMTQVFLNLLSDDIRFLLQQAPALPDKAEIDRLNRKIVGLMRNSDIAKVKLYNPQGTVVFSTDSAQIGTQQSANPGFLAARTGKVASELTHRTRFSTHDQEKTNVDLLSSYVPMQHDGQVIAVFELYQDVTFLVGLLGAALWQIGAIVLFILGALYVTQLLVVRHAHQVIAAQEAMLEAANRELDQRITERTQELQLSEQRVRELLDEQQLIFNNAHVGILLVRNRQIIKSNQRIADMFGFASPAEYEGQSVGIFYGSSADDEAAGRLGHGQLAEQGLASFETRMRRQDGRDIWVHLTGRPLDPTAALEEASIWVFTDITERKQTEVELGIAATAFESQEGMLVTDANTVILRVNKAFTDITGYSAEEVIGRTPSMLRSDRHDPAFYAAMWESIERTGFWQGEIWDRRKNGEVYPKLLTISAVRGPDNVVTHYVGTQTDITERKVAEDKIKHLAFFDQLTDLPNRTLLLDRLKQSMIAGNRNGTYGALLFIDLDHFKTLNDTLGHDQGDLLLQLVARRLTASVREDDTVARLGGDEFVVVLGNLDENIAEAVRQTESIGKKILAAVNQTYPLGNVDHQCTASIGATLFHGNSTSIDDLLKQADLAMYKSKETGRNAIHFFDLAMQTVVVERAALEADLRRAIQEGQFTLHYQPQVVGAGHITGAEALVRWQHPQRGTISPVDFIPLAEESGLILPLGRWVLQTACAQLAAWAGRPQTAKLTVAVNVSAEQFRQADFVDQVLNILEQSGANPQRLKLELTESLLIDNIQDIVDKMVALKGRGVGFSLDDFGTGYSSLSYLKRLPLDQLKIDRSFVRDVLDDANNAAIAATIVALARSLGLGVIAEGVETAPQRDFLASSGCHAYQGYFFSRPLPAAEFEQFVRRETQALKAAEAALRQSSGHQASSTSAPCKGKKTARRVGVALPANSAA